MKSDDRTIPFLDCLVQLNDNNTFSTKIYRKPTHSDLYLNYHSSHPHAVKLAVVRSLATRNQRLCSNPSELAIEQMRPTPVLMDNGFLLHMVRRVMKELSMTIPTRNASPPVATVVIL